MNYKTMEKLQKRKVKAMEYVLHHDDFPPKVIYFVIPDKPALLHPCEKWFDVDYYIHSVTYIYK